MTIPSSNPTNPFTKFAYLYNHCNDNPEILKGRNKVILWTVVATALTLPVFGLGGLLAFAISSNIQYNNATKKTDTIARRTFDVSKESKPEPLTLTSGKGPWKVGDREFTSIKDIILLMASPTELSKSHSDQLKDILAGILQLDLAEENLDDETLNALNLLSKRHPEIFKNAKGPKVEFSEPRGNKVEVLKNNLLLNSDVFRMIFRRNPKKTTFTESTPLTDKVFSSFSNYVNEQKLNETLSFDECLQLWALANLYNFVSLKDRIERELESSRDLDILQLIELQLFSNDNKLDRLESLCLYRIQERLENGETQHNNHPLIKDIKSLMAQGAGFLNIDNRGIQRIAIRKLNEETVQALQNLSLRANFEVRLVNITLSEEELYALMNSLPNVHNFTIIGNKEISNLTVPTHINSIEVYDCKSLKSLSSLNLSSVVVWDCYDIENIQTPEATKFTLNNSQVTSLQLPKALDIGIKGSNPKLVSLNAPIATYIALDTGDNFTDLNSPSAESLVIYHAPSLEKLYAPLATDVRIGSTKLKKENITVNEHCKLTI